MMPRPHRSDAAPAREGPIQALPVLLADRQGVAFVATARNVESLRVPRRYWGTEVGVVPIPASDDEIRAAELLPSSDPGAWPRVAPRPDLLAPALSRLLSGEHVELGLQPGRDGLKAVLMTPEGQEQPFPIAPKDSLGFLAAVFHHAPRGVILSGSSRPPRILLSIRPATQRHEYRLRLAGAVAQAPPTSLSDIGLSSSLLELLLEVLDRPSGLLLVSGGPGSGRSTTLELLASALAARNLRGGRIGSPPAVAAPPNLAWLADAVSDWPFPESLHAAAPDFVLLERIEGSADLILAARLAASGTLVLAGAPAAEPEALGRAVAGELEAGSAPAVPVTVLGQALVRTVCQACLTWETIPAEQARRLGFHRRDLEEMERKGGLAVPAGTGCSECAVTGSAGLTGVFEYVGSEGVAGSLPRMREDGWRKAVQGIALYTDVAALPGAHRTMRTLREITVHTGITPLPSEPARRGESKPEPAGVLGRRPGQVQAPAAAAASEASTSAEAEALARMLREARARNPVDPRAIPLLARTLAERGLSATPLQEMLAPGRGYHMARHAVNTALLAVRIGSHLGQELDAVETARLALLHDVGLLETGIDPGAELPPVLTEESLDAGGARFHPERALAALGAGEEATTQLIVHVHSMLRFEKSAAERPRADLRAQTVALASLIDLTFHGPQEQRPSDLHDVTSLLMAQQGVRFSPVLFRALLRTIPIFPVGAYVELSSGDLARVVSLNENNHFRPRVELSTNSGDPTAERRIVDLARAPFLHIRQRVAGAMPAAVGRS